MKDLVSEVKNCTLQEYITDFFAHRIMYLGNQLPNQIKNSNSVEHFKIKLDGFRNNGKKKNLRVHFWELSNKLINRI